MKSAILATVLIAALVFLALPLVSAHRSGCHRWHSCPSDTGSYTCGDLGYRSGCPDSRYTTGGTARPAATLPGAGGGELRDPKVGNQGACLGTGRCFTDQVRGIYDGDTLVIGRYVIRLALVDAPERNEPGYQEAASFAERICPVGTTAVVDEDGRQPIDRYSRMVAVVRCQGGNLNERLLATGHATIATGYCRLSEFGRQGWARAGGCPAS